MLLSAAELALLSRLLDEALDLEPAQIDGWLAALPPEQVHLRSHMRAMLAARMTRGAGFMSGGPSLDSPLEDEVAFVGELIGPYRVIRAIGQGGMGAVWLAERADGSYSRQVALKLPRLAWGAGLAERMARERDIGALLEHPHIARLYDAGVDRRGRPYLALEYIEGVAIDAWCEAQGLDTAARLRLFLQVVRAVAYAHGRLVVHRDLKPSNVLVSADGQAHLLDFGIAKLLQQTVPARAALTEELGRMLTPRYASPEQLRGEDISITSDIYSLGVLLYELLTGRLPCEPGRTSLGALEAAILDNEPLPASQRVKDGAIRKALRGDIDAILSKALMKDPAERYATADALADDLQRHLAGEVVLARPNSLGQRIVKSMRRHKVGFAAAAAVLVAVISGAGAALVQAERANLEAARSSAVRDFMFDLVGDAEPDQRQPDAEVTGRQMVTGAITRARRSFASDLRLRAELMGELARMQMKLGDRDGARPVVEEANALLERLAPPGDAALNRTRVQLAEIAFDDEKLDTAQAKAQLALRSCTQPGRDCLKVRAFASNVLSNAELRKNRFSSALEHARDNIALTEAAFDALDPELTMAWVRLAQVHREAGQFGQASTALERAEVLARNVTLRAVDKESLVLTRGVIDLDTGAFSAARETFAQLAAATRSDDLRAYYLRFLSEASIELGLPQDARAQIDAALSLLDAGTITPDLLFARQDRARAQSLDSEFSGLTDIRDVIAGLTRIGYPADSYEVLRARRYQAEILARQGEFVTARDQAEALIRDHLQAESPWSLELAQLFDLLGCIRQLEGHALESVPLHQRARPLYMKTLPANHPAIERNQLFHLYATEADIKKSVEQDLQDLATRFKSRFPLNSTRRLSIDRCLRDVGSLKPDNCLLFF